MKRILKQLLGLAGVVLLAGHMNAAIYYVNNMEGRDDGNGLSQKNEGANCPFRTIRRGVKALKAGDTLSLVATGKPYYSALVLRNKKGTTAQPITIDGQMAVLCGSRSLNKQEWTRDGELYVKGIKLQDNILRRYFMVFNGRINRMNRVLKGHSSPLKKAVELKPGEWTYDKHEEKVYIKLGKGGTLDDVAEPVVNLGSGVKLINNCQHVIIKNFITEFFWNDGYNIHGDNKHIRFENIIARYNGDDGLSAHETSEISVRNYISLGNGTGICHVQESVTESENIYIVDSAGIDLYTLNKKNQFKNIIIKSSSPKGIFLKSSDSELINGHFRNMDIKKTNVIFQSEKCSVNNLSAVNYNILVRTKKLKGDINVNTELPTMLLKMLENLKQVFGSKFPQPADG